MARIFIGHFESQEAARQLIYRLHEAGVPDHDIRVVSPRDAAGLEAVTAQLAKAGMADAEASAYADAARGGESIVLVNSDDFTADNAYDVLRGAGMLDISQHLTEERQDKRDAARGDPYYTPSEALEPSVAHKWEESNKLATGIGTVAGALHGAAAGGVLGGPAGAAIGGAAGAIIGGTGGAVADAAMEALKQEDAAHQDQAVREAQAQEVPPDPESGREPNA